MKPLLALSLSLFLAVQSAMAVDMSERISDATAILDKKQGSLSAIPQELLNHAHGIAFATVTKGGIGIGGMGGDGIVLVHLLNSPTPTWSAPSAFSISGGSLGAQIGFTKTKYIFILNTEAAVHQFAGQGKLKWDATAMGTAGEDNAIERESTAELEAHAVIIYRDSGGVFGGATFGGTTIETKNSVNHAAYGSHVYLKDIFDGKVLPPMGSERLYKLLNGQR